VQNIDLSAITLEKKDTFWPVVPGDYFVVSRNASVAVSTLASEGLAESIAESQPDGLCIIGKTETENIGIDKIIRNMVTNPAVRFLIITGKDPEGHRSGATLLALLKNGVNRKMRVTGSPGKRPVLTNVTFGEIETFRRQVETVDMIGCEDAAVIIAKIAALDARQAEPFIGVSYSEAKPVAVATAVEAAAVDDVALDKAGYFVIIPECEKNDIIVEHYSYDNRILRTVKGSNARDLYSAIINNGWLSELSHAAYLGKELEKAELSMKYGFKYVQDGI
jgi:tetrahydromethanopterin S-methyltransferase subunit A